MDAKLTNDGISTISNFKPALRVARKSPRTKMEIYWGRQAGLEMVIWVSLGSFRNGGLDTNL